MRKATVRRKKLTFEFYQCNDPKLDKKKITIKMMNFRVAKSLQKHVWHAKKISAMQRIKDDHQLHL